MKLWSTLLQQLVFEQNRDVGSHPIACWYKVQKDFYRKKINQGIRNNSFDYTADTVRVIKSMIDTSFASLMKSIGLYVTNLIRSDNTYLMLLFLD